MCETAIYFCIYNIDYELGDVFVFCILSFVVVLVVRSAYNVYVTHYLVRLGVLIIHSRMTKRVLFH